MLIQAVSRKTPAWMKAWRMTSTARAARSFAAGPAGAPGTAITPRSARNQATRITTTKKSQSHSAAAVAGASSHTHGPNCNHHHHNHHANGTNGTNGKNGTNGAATVFTSAPSLVGQAKSEGMDPTLGPWSECHMPTRWGDFRMRSYKDGPIVMHLGLRGAGGEELTSDTDRAPLIRIHSECVTSEIFGSLRCDCAYQLEESLRRMGEEGRGALIYLKQEGRGLGLHEKIRAYGLQEAGFDTVEANLMLGHAVDYRTYGDVKPIIDAMGLANVRLLTNNPEKISFVKDACDSAEIEPIIVPDSELEKSKWMKDYVQTKKEKCFHRFE